MFVLSRLERYRRFTYGLWKFLREPMTFQDSSRIMKRRLEARTDNLLAAVKKAIYDNPSSPYLGLLKHAGCQYGDFKRLVYADGVEPALRKLSKAGVYVSIEEFKGKAEAVRGSQVFRFNQEDFNNPLVSGYFETRTGASRSAGTRAIYDFDYLTEMGAVRRIFWLDAYEALHAPLAVWAPIMPGSGPATVLIHAKIGKIPSRWFSQIDRKGFKPSLKNRMATNFIIYMGRVFGAGLPKPEYVTYDDVWKIARWISDTVKEQGGCSLCTYPSSAVRICQAAKELSLDISGAKFFLAGEPLTEIKRREIESVGALAYSQYIFTEGGWVGTACTNPVASDDVHLLTDTLALIQRRRRVPYCDVSVDAFLFTSLLLSAPKMLLNVESGDYGVIESRDCGCRFWDFGFTEHICGIRSFDKLTGEGMTIVGTELVRIIEEILPSRFGGTSIDYQLVEEEDGQGHTRISLLVSPEVGEIDEAEMVKAVIGELGKGRDLERMMAYFWSQARAIQVKRMSPQATSRGKLLPLHIGQSK